MNLRVGTRGSDLALWQTRHVASLMKAQHDVVIEEVVIQTHAEKQPKQALSAGIWPSGGFVREIEHALAEGEIDFAVHSYKDLPSADPPALVIAAVLERAAMHDCLIARDEATADALREGVQRPNDTFSPQIGTSSPRRACQLRKAFNAQIVPLRGNVPTRLRKVAEDDLDAVCLAAAGLDRLGLAPPHRVALPLERFPTAPAQGAIAVQVRDGSDAERVVRSIDHAATRRAVMAERSFLAAIEASCQTPVSASARLLDSGAIALHVQLFGEGDQQFEAREEGEDPIALGRHVARAALAEVDVS